jgi:hypothetical protein
MTVSSRSPGVIELSGRCGVEDAELLQRFLLAAPRCTVEWTGCEYVHAAVLQVLLAARPPVRGVPSSAFLGSHVARLLGVLPLTRPATAAEPNAQGGT